MLAKTLHILEDAVILDECMHMNIGNMFKKLCTVPTLLHTTLYSGKNFIANK